MHAHWLVLQLFFHLWFSLVETINSPRKGFVWILAWPLALILKSDALLIAILVNPKIYSHTQNTTSIPGYSTNSFLKKNKKTAYSVYFWPIDLFRLQSIWIGFEFILSYWRQHTAHYSIEEEEKKAISQISAGRHWQKQQQSTLHVFKT